MNERCTWDKDKVPDTFPKMRAHSWVFSEVPAKPQRPYYDARKVWKWFQGFNKMRDGLCDYCWTTVSEFIEKGEDDE